MNGNSFIIRRKTLIGMVFIGLVLLGVVSQRQLPVELIPSVELPFLMVFVSADRRQDPATIEKEAVIDVEGAISATGGVERIESDVGSRSARIMVEYEKGVDLKYAYLDLEDRMRSVRSSIPDGYRVMVFKGDTESLSNTIIELQVRGGGGVDRVRSVVDEDIAGKLESIDGVSGVEVVGGRKRSLEAVVDREVLEGYGITLSRIGSLIAQSGAANEFVGHAVEKDRKYFVNVITEYLTLDDLRDIVVVEEGPVLLGDIADIYFGVREQESISRIDGRETVSVMLNRERQVNMVDLSDEIRSVVDKLNAGLSSKDIEIVVTDDSAEPIRENISLIVRLAIIGGVLAVIILWFFLRNLRLVLVVALAIPVSIYAALNVFYAAGITINSLTLVGIALAVGMLVDNSIVVLENIYRLASAGMESGRAVIRGVSEVWRSILAATATTITVFLPFVFSSDFIIRTLGKNVGISIISTLLVSLAVALLLVPMVTHYFLSRRTAAETVPAGPGRLREFYLVILKTCMRFPARTVTGAVVVFFASLIICLGLSATPSGEEETGSFNVYLTMPTGSTLEVTDLAVREIEERLADLPEKRELHSNIFEDEAQVTVHLEEGYTEIEGRSLPSIRDGAMERLRRFPAGDISFEQPAASRRFGRRGGGMQRTMMRMFGFGDTDETILIKGEDFESMQRFAENIRGYIEDLPSTASAGVSVGSQSPEIRMMFDQRLMSYGGISMQSVSSELQAFPREVETGAVFKHGGEEYSIVIRSAGEEEERGADDLRRMRIPAGELGTVELSDITDMLYSSGISSIRRVNREKQIEVNYSFVSSIASSRSAVEQARAEIDAMLEGIVTPEGIAVEQVRPEDRFREFKFLILAAFILIYMILASVFESLTTPLVMMFTIPLAAIGALWLLIFTGTPLIESYTLTGFLILLGVVVNNGIILIDYSLILKRRGFRTSRALMTAGLARMRPILITAITTIVAMIPLAMGKTEDIAIGGSQFAVTVIGGLAFSTLFTLVFIPVVYSGLESALAWMAGRDWRLKALMGALLACGAWLILERVDSTVWRSAFIAALLFAVPSLTWFVLTSLRRASADVGSGEMTISVRNLVKVYDRPARFVREWRRAAGRSPRGTEAGLEMHGLLWRLPLLGFMVYFVYLYLGSLFWAFVLSHAVWFFTIDIWNMAGRSAARGGAGRLPRIVPGLLLWGVPAANLVYFHLEFDNTPAVVFIAILWAVSLTVFTTSRRLHSREVNIARIEGRLAGIRRAFYRLVLMIPLIGRRKRPFKALDRVSLEIGSGMFGLLGPNGAGKTTLMRVICGILDQSYGKVYINGIDTAEKREELQGLIGYLPQEFGTYENMTAREFLDYQAILRGITDRARREEMVDHVLGAVHIEERAGDRIGSFSGGMKQRVGIAQILLHLPRILVVDEPTAGLDPRERIRFRNLLVELSRDRVVIFSTHIIEDIYSSCNRVAVLDRGRLLYLDEPSKMTSTAEGKVWSFTVAPDEFERIRKEYLVVHHMRDGERIKARCLSERPPVDGASTVRPTLEDAYLWLLRRPPGTGEARPEEEDPDDR